nr:uncharacterized protein LOC109754975 [Aegilops tauschii subsp. strangulata]
MATALAGCAWPSVPSKLYVPFTLRCLWCAPAMSGKPAEKTLLGHVNGVKWNRKKILVLAQSGSECDRGVTVKRVLPWLVTKGKWSLVYYSCSHKFVDVCSVS